MTKRQKQVVTMLGAWALVFGIVPAANAMHIMEGYLPVGYCIMWGVLCIPFLAAGFFSIKKTLTGNRRAITLLAMAGAFIFVISSLKIPSVTGSCSHMTGTGLGAILFGPSAVSILGIIVLLFRQSFWLMVVSRPSVPTPFPWPSQVHLYPLGSTSCARK